MQYLVILGMFVAALSLVGCDRPEEEVAKEAPASQPARAEESVQAPVASDEPEPAEPEPLVENAEGEPLPLDSMTIEEKEAFLFDSVTPEKGEFPSAAWEIFFPTPNENWGHQFEADGAYSYWDHSAEAIRARYYYTDGIWRIEGNTIQVQLSRYVMYDEEPVEVEPGIWQRSSDRFSVSGRTEVPITDDTWHTIGTLESVRVGLVLMHPFEDRLAEFPPTIRLRPLFQDQVLDEEVRYWGVGRR